MKKDLKRGSILVIVLWIIFFWPIAIWYYFNRVWSEETFSKQIVTEEEYSEIVNKRKNKGDE